MPRRKKHHHTAQYGSGGGGKGGFSPASISGLINWYDFSNASTLFTDTARTTQVSADTNEIKGVTDLGSAGKHLSNGAGPQYKLNIQNGKSIARFDGTDDMLTNGSFAFNAAQTIFIVMKKATAPAAGAQIAWYATSNQSAQIYTVSGTSATDWLYYRNAAAGTTVITGATANAWGLLTLNYASVSSLTILYNGSATVAAFDPEDEYATATTLALGAQSASTAPSNVDYGEVLIYNTSLSGGDQTLVTTGLRTKWGLP